MITDDVVYGSHSMHIKGEISAKLNTMASDINDYELSLQEAEEFLVNGYFISNNVVDNVVIDNARIYIDSQYNKWLKISKRQDDWRTHFQMDLTNIDIDYKENGPILDLLLHSPQVLARLRDLMGDISGIFYTQVAFRTPVPSSMRAVEGIDYQVGAEYHLDGQANASGERFPDHWTVLVGIALVDILSEDKGNFTVFPGAHTLRNWSPYPIEKRAKTLPSFDTLHKIKLRKGDVVFCHVLLPHRGGRNILEPAERDVDSIVKNIQTETREMVFFRVKKKGIEYNSHLRSLAVLHDPWSEHVPMYEKYPSLRELMLLNEVST